MRWCTISDQEQQKCIEFKNKLQEIDNATTPGCVQATNAVECMKKIAAGDADLVTLDGGDVYKAGKTQCNVMSRVRGHHTCTPLHLFCSGLEN